MKKEEKKTEVFHWLARSIANLSVFWDGSERSIMLCSLLVQLRGPVGTERPWNGLTTYGKLKYHGRSYR
jgi:hypothetical protein